MFSFAFSNAFFSADEISVFTSEGFTANEESTIPSNFSVYFLTAESPFFLTSSRIGQTASLAELKSSFALFRIPLQTSSPRLVLRMEIFMLPFPAEAEKWKEKIRGFISE